MVTITIGRDYGVDMRRLDFSRFYDGVETVGNSSIFAIRYQTGEVSEFRGSGFTYNNFHEPTGGVVKAYSNIYEGDRYFKLDGIDLPVTEIKDAAITFSTKDDYALIKSQMSGSDKFIGGDLDDYALGYDGNDRLVGRGDADSLIGGKGADTFVYTKVGDSNWDAYDGIGDFSVKGGDIIDLAAVDANGKKAGNGEFDFIGADDFSGRAGELQVFFVEENTAILGDVNGDQEADLVIALVGNIKITESDFLL